MGISPSEFLVRELRQRRVAAGLTQEAPRHRRDSAQPFSSNGGACVEVADNLPGVVLVRDTKDRAGGTLTLSPDSWRLFVTEIATRR